MAHFGLGDATNVDLVRVEWPSGNVQELTDVAPNQILTVTESAGITPARPTVSLNGSVLLRFQGGVGQYQWHLNGAALAGQTNRTLNLTSLVADQQGRYSLVMSNATTMTTNYGYLRVDTTFTKITEGLVVTDTGGSTSLAWWDADNDGLLDLFVGNSADPPDRDAFYHNDGGGVFTRVTTNAIAQLSQAFDAAPGDYDNDGNVDLFVERWGSRNDLYRNEGGGVFTRMTASQVGPPVSDGGSAYTAAWGDYDDDGFIDLFVANYSGQNDYLYRNNGDGSFSKMTTNQVGQMVADRANSVACVWADYDNDGHLDLYVTGPNYLYRNLGNGRFEPVIVDPVVPTEVGSATWGDYDNDGFQDLLVAYGPNGCSLFRNLAGQGFTNVAAGARLKLNSHAELGVWGDYDNDGYLDLFVQSYMSTNALFHNNGDGTFTSVNAGNPITDGTRDMAAAWVDYDNDGFLDLSIICGNGQLERNLLYRNTGNGNAWLKVKLQGTTSNRSGIGAKVRVKATIQGKAFWQMREISGNSAWGGGNGLLTHFGLGDATNVATLRVEWPSGAIEEFTNVGPDQMLTLVEPSLGGAFGPDQLFHLTITGNTNKTYELGVSSDLLDWTVLTNCAGRGPNATVEVCDPAAGQTQRYYRLK